MAFKVKQRCVRCKKNYVITTAGNSYSVCYDCQKDELSKPIKDAKMRKLFDIPEEFYKENAFLRSVKSYYMKFGSLTDKQLEMFKITVEKLKTKVV